jgi:hypothetical protein
MSSSSAGPTSAPLEAPKSGVVLLSALAGTALVLIFAGLVLCCRCAQRHTSAEYREKAREKERKKLAEKEAERLRRLEEGGEEGKLEELKKEVAEKSKKKRKKKLAAEALLAQERTLKEAQLNRLLVSRQQQGDDERIDLSNQNGTAEALGWHRTIIAPDGTTVVLDNENLETLVLGKPVHLKDAENATKPLSRAGAFLPAPQRSLPIPPDYKPPPWFPTLDTERSALKLQRSFEAAVEETFQALVRPPPLPLLPPEAISCAEKHGPHRPLSRAGEEFGSLAVHSQRLTSVHPTDFIEMQLAAPDEKRRLAMLRRKAEAMVLEAIRREREATSRAEDQGAATGHTERTSEGDEL